MSRRYRDWPDWFVLLCAFCLALAFVLVTSLFVIQEVTP